MNTHTVGWIDDEMCELRCDGRSVGTMSIYDFEPCPACGVPVKLRQVCEVIEGAAGVPVADAREEPSAALLGEARAFEASFPTVYDSDREAHRIIRALCEALERSGALGTGGVPELEHGHPKGFSEGCGFCHAALADGVAPSGASGADALRAQLRDLAAAAQSYLTAEAHVGVTEDQLRALNHRLGSLAGPHLVAYQARATLSRGSEP